MNSLTCRYILFTLCLLTLAVSDVKAETNLEREARLSDMGFTSAFEISSSQNPSLVNIQKNQKIQKEFDCINFKKSTESGLDWNDVCYGEAVMPKAKAAQSHYKEKRDSAKGASLSKVSLNNNSQFVDEWNEYLAESEGLDVSTSSNMSESEQFYLEAEAIEVSATQKPTQRALPSDESEGFVEEPRYVEVQKVPVQHRSNSHDKKLLKFHPEEADYLPNTPGTLPEKYQSRATRSLEQPFFDGEYYKPSYVEVAADVYDFNYKEPTLGVEDDGELYGGYAAYTYRWRENGYIKSWKDIFSDELNLNMLRIDARFNYGEVDYVGSGTHNGIKDWTVESRVLLGYDIPVSENLLFTPYVGLGYRYLNDGFDKVPSKVIDGQRYLSGYERESQYVYFPLGIEIVRKLKGHWSLTLTGEYDYLVDGEQTSHLEDSVAPGVDPDYDVLQNDQNSGYGLRGSLKLTKHTKNFDLFIEPFVRYWDIEDSEVNPITINGQVISTSPTTILAGLEPENKTKEYGIRVGARF